MTRLSVSVSLFIPNTINRSYLMHAQIHKILNGYFEIWHREHSTMILAIKKERN